MLYLLCDLELWLWPWILKVKYLKSYIIEIRGWIDRKGCESIGCWTQVVTSNFYLTHELDLVFSRSNFWQPYFRNGKAYWLGMREMWVGYNVGCTMGFLLAHSAWQIDQFPTCWPMNGLFVHWSRGWGVLSFSEHLVIIILQIKFHDASTSIVMQHPWYAFPRRCGKLFTTFSVCWQASLNTITVMWHEWHFILEIKQLC